MSIDYLDKTGLEHLIDEIMSRIPTQRLFPITEDMVTVTTDATKGVAPYSTSYGYTNIEIDPDSGFEWVEGGLYLFVVDTKMVVASANRNVRVRIGSDGDWKPVMEYNNAICGGNSYFTKAMTIIFQYKTTNQPNGALHREYDANTTYAYLPNYITGDTTDSPFVIDANGYGARYTLAWPTTPEGVETKYSSYVLSSSTGTTKKAVPCKLYADRNPLYIYSANIVAGAKAVNSVYQDYYGHDLRYTANTNNNYLLRSTRAFLYLKDFDPADYSFKADATVGNIVSDSKLATRFPDSIEGDVYLYFLGWTTATWYTVTPQFSKSNNIYKYTPSTGELIIFSKSSSGQDIESMTLDEIDALF